MARRAKIYCTIKHERGKKPGQGYVARFFRARDHVLVGTAFWNKKDRRFENVRGAGNSTLTPADVQQFTTLVPHRIARGAEWNSEVNPYAE